MEATREKLRGQSAICRGQATSENQTPSSTEVSERPLGSRADLALASGSDLAGDRSAFSSYQKT